MDCLLENGANPEKIIIKEYILHEGWYDESPWEIANLNEAIELFNELDEQSIENNDSHAEIINKVPEINKAIIKFLELAKLKHVKVYIDYD